MLVLHHAYHQYKERRREHNTYYLFSLQVPIAIISLMFYRPKSTLENMFLQINPLWLKQRDMSIQVTNMQKQSKLRVCWIHFLLIVSFANSHLLSNIYQVNYQTFNFTKCQTNRWFCTKILKIWLSWFVKLILGINAN